MKRMYGIFDVALDSDIPLPELPEVETAKTVIRVQSGMIPAVFRNNRRGSIISKLLMMRPVFHVQSWGILIY